MADCRRWVSAARPCAWPARRALARGQPDRRQDQRRAHRVVPARRFAQQRPGGERGIHGRQVHHQRGARRTQLAQHVAIGLIGKETRQQPGQHDQRKRFAAEARARLEHRFQRGEGQQHQHAAEGDRRQPRGRAQCRRPALQQHGVGHPRSGGRQDPQVAHGEAHGAQVGQVALGDDEDHAAQRQRHAGALPGTDTLVQQLGRREGNGHRRGGVDQADVDGAGGVRPHVDESAADPHAQHAQHQHLLPLAPPLREAGDQRAGRQRQQQRQGQRPAAQRQRVRRDHPVRGARNDVVRGPKCRRDPQQQLGDALASGGLQWRRGSGSAAQGAPPRMVEAFAAARDAAGRGVQSLDAR
jgi:hypothetical protein